MTVGERTKVARYGKDSAATQWCEPSRQTRRGPRLALPVDIVPEPVPIWLAALMAARCAALANGEGHVVPWSHVRGRAWYTNSGAETEILQPLGVRLGGGQTVAVSWCRGETAYTVEVYPQRKRRA